MRKLAPNKSHKTILRPMRMMTDTISEHRLAIGKSARMERSAGNQYLTGSIFAREQLEKKKDSMPAEPQSQMQKSSGSIVRETVPYTSHALAVPKDFKKDLTRPFAPAGQSTQMIIGATPETDYHLLKTTQHLYQTYDLKRVFYSAYVPLNEDSLLPALGTPTPLLREHRLYQADWLLRFYGFQADELLSEQRPDFNEQLDPKCDWALRHLEQFPVEINTAPYDVILRIPGVGPKSAMRIVQARRSGTLDFSHLKRIGVVLKRAHYFITCSGKMMYRIPLEEQYITRQLIGTNARENWQIAHQNEGNYRQMSLFDDFQMQA